MSDQSLADFEFSDVFLSDDRYLIKGVPGKPELFDIPDKLRKDADALYAECKQRYEQDEKNEFSFFYDGIFYRVAVMPSISGRYFVLRKAMQSVPDMAELPIPPPKHMVEQLTDPHLDSGLVIISGPMGSGKTTTASSIIASRLRREGGIAVTIEDPPELPLEGDYENGACFQMEVETTFADSIARAMRMGSPDMLLMGECRTPQDVSEAVRAGVNGHFIVTTVHARGLEETMRRMIALGKEVDGDAASDLLAEGVAAVVHQELDTQNQDLQTTSLFIPHSQESVGIRGKIRQEKVHQLSSEIERQRTQRELNRRSDRPNHPNNGQD